MRRRPAAAILIAVLLITGIMRLMGCEFDYGMKTAAKRAEGKELTVRGRVMEVKFVREDLFRLLLKEEGGGKILISVTGDFPYYYDLPGRIVEAQVVGEVPQGASNPGCFDYARYLSSEGIYMTALLRGENLRVGELHPNFLLGSLINGASNFRHAFSDALSRALSEVGQSPTGGEAELSVEGASFNLTEDSSKPERASFKAKEAQPETGTASPDVREMSSENLRREAELSVEGASFNLTEDSSKPERASPKVGEAQLETETASPDARDLSGENLRGEAELSAEGASFNLTEGSSKPERASFKAKEAQPETGIASPDAREPSAGGSRTGGLFSGMLFGDKSLMSEELNESFRENGTAHILSVSGLHVGIIYGLLTLIMGKRRRSRGAACLIILGLAGCGLLASFSISVIRAIVMIIIHMAAGFLHRRYDLISSACITAAIFIILNPNTIYNAGFILSFASVISLGIIGPGMNRMIKKQNLITRTLIPITAIQLGMAPVNAMIFNYFSFAAFIANIPVIFLSGIMIPLGILTALVFAIVSLMPAAQIIFNLLCQCCRLLGEMMIFFNDLTGAYGRLSFKIESPSIAIVIAFYLMLYLLFSESIYLKPMNKKKLVIAVSIVSISFGISLVQEKMRPEVVFVDVGQGDCIHIRTPSGENYLIDGGGSANSNYDVGVKTLLPYLLKNGVRKLDGVFISHMDGDHYKGIASLSREIDIGTVFLYSGYYDSRSAVSEILNKPEENLQFIHRGYSISLDKGVKIDVIYPSKLKTGEEFIYSSEGKSEETNEKSLVMLLDYRGIKILLTGDISEKEEEKLRGNYSCHIVKVPHHGSKYSSSQRFVNGIKSDSAVIQVGKNNFGHPAETVVERYREKGIIVFRNDLDGAVLVDIKSEGYSIKGYKSGAKVKYGI